MNRGKLAVQMLLIASLILSAAAGPVLADHSAEKPNTDAQSVHDPHIDTNVTISEHDVSWEPLHYEDNSGDTTEFPGEVNDSYANPYQITYTHIDTTAYTSFPINSGTEDEDTWADAANWSSDGSSGGTVSVSDSTSAQNVDSVTVDVTGQTTSSDVANATFDGYKIDSDIQQRYIQLALNVDTLDSGARVEIRFNDSTDGDYVEAVIEPDDDGSMGNNITNSTGDGYVFQQQVGSMTVMGSGDGTMDNINSTKVSVQDANATVEIVGMNVEDNGAWDLGTQMVNESDDDGKNTEKELTQINESGATHITSLDSMGSDFDSATIRDLTVPVKVYQSSFEQPDDYERYNATAEKADRFENFEWRLNDYRRFELPSAYDLSYADTSLDDVAVVPSNRYQTVEYATDVGETDFSDISSWTDATSSYDSLDKNVTLTSSINSGEPVAIHYDYVMSDAEHDATFSEGDTGEMDDGSGGGFFSGDGGGGLLGAIVNPITGAIAAVLSFLGLKAKSG